MLFKQNTRFAEADFFNLEMSGSACVTVMANESKICKTILF